LISLVDEAIRSPLILVVDDDSELCANLWDIFHQRKFRIHTAGDSAHASRALQDTNFDVVLVDMKLPDGDGSRLLDVIKGHNPDAKTIVITGHLPEMESRVDQALARGANAVIYKPFDIDQLIRTVTDLSSISRTTPHP
jgi:DNA-binding NtrC family response regulator